MFSHTNFQHNKRIGGFSLIEVLITIAIVGIITAIVVIRYGAFNSSVLLRNQAYEIALSIREAQVFSVSVRGDAIPGAFREPYGIYIQNLPTQQYILFADSDRDGAYDTDPFSSEKIDTFTIDSRFEIYELCLGSSAASPGCGVSNLAISFARPDFDAIMKAPSVSTGIHGEIRIRPVDGSAGQRSIIVQSTGLIAVE